MDEMSVLKKLEKISQVNLFKKDQEGNFTTGIFVARPFHLDYEKANLLIADSWKAKANGIPQGAFLIAYYMNEHDVSEALLLRAIRPCKLPDENDVISSIIEHYKGNIETTGHGSKLDPLTRYDFSYSGLECSILGTFYIDQDDSLKFGADVENFYSAHHYKVFKPNNEILGIIANLNLLENHQYFESQIEVGRVRYSSTHRFQNKETPVPVYVSPVDFLGKRTALFGMTRTGKSNTVKKIIEATHQISEKANLSIISSKNDSAKNKNAFAINGTPTFKVGQIIFDINGEYANPNLQDEGTAIFEIFESDTVRYSTIEKENFKVMKINFYKDLTAGFEMIKNALEAANITGDYINHFLSIDLTPLEDDDDFSNKVRYGVKRAAYFCCLHRAGFKASDNFKVKFTINKEITESLPEGLKLDYGSGVSLKEASDFFQMLWEKHDEIEYLREYKNKKGRAWADEQLEAILKILTGKNKNAEKTTVSGYKKISHLAKLHTPVEDEPYAEGILRNLREGKIVIVDLSQGDPVIQTIYSERICRAIFVDAMENFISLEPNNFIQFYFEEAHNLFPKKDDKDLSIIYNRIAKEGAKLHLGMTYATQEVSSISSNILKNTQNWFTAHLNNEDETKELKKYYDFKDFCDSLMRFSSLNDKGFVRMKTYSNPYTVPVQIKKFSQQEGK